jgi:hypothetical protein
MYLGRADTITICGFDKKSVQKIANDFCEMYGYYLYTEYSQFYLFKLKRKYFIHLIKPIDFEIKLLNGREQ